MYVRMLAMNFRVVALAIAMTTIMTSSIEAMTSHPVPIYSPIYSPNGTRLCAVVEPFLQFEMFVVEKLTRCAVYAMSAQPPAVFNYKTAPPTNLTAGSECTIFQSLPSSYEQLDHCVGYEVLFVPLLVTLAYFVETGNDQSSQTFNENYHALAGKINLGPGESNGRQSITTSI